MNTQSREVEQNNPTVMQALKVLLNTVRECSSNNNAYGADGTSISLEAIECLVNRLEYEAQRQEKVENLSYSKTNGSERKTVFVIFDAKKKKMHFTGTALQGQGHDLWLPCDISTRQTIHQVVEATMVGCGIAHNVTSVQPKRVCGVCTDYEVVYNSRA